MLDVDKRRRRVLLARARRSAAVSKQLQRRGAYTRRHGPFRVVSQLGQLCRLLRLWCLDGLGVLVGGDGHEDRRGGRGEASSAGGRTAKRRLELARRALIQLAAVP